MWGQRVYGGDTLSKKNARRQSFGTLAVTPGNASQGIPKGSGRYRSLAYWGALFMATVIAYSPALEGGMLWDDSSHVTAPKLQSLHGLWRIWSELGATQQYYPFLHSAFWLEFRVWGESVLGYHLVNVFLHALAACLVVCVARSLSLPGAWFAGFVFALHPVSVEAVAWISEQKSTLSTVFSLSAFLTYLRFRESQRSRTYFAALGLFVLALLSKSVTATLPAVLLVVFWWQQGRLDWRRDVRPLLPWFAIAIPMGIFTAWVERTYIGAVGSDFNLTFVQRILLAGRALWFYALKILFPGALAFSYPRWNLDPAAWWQWLYPAGIVAIAAVLLIAARRTRGPLASFLIFAGTLVPVLGFLNVLPFRYAWVADHFQYLASLGLIVPLAAFATTEVRRLAPAQSFAIASAVVALLGILTFRQSANYRDEETLYQSSLAVNPASWLMHNNLGIVLESKPGRLNDAIAEFQAALKLNPIYSAQAHFNLADAYAKLDPPDVTRALAEYRTGLQIEPNYVEAHTNMGTLLAGIPGRSGEAIAEFQKVVQLQPGMAQAHANLGNVLAQAPGRLPEAVVEFETAVQLDPGIAELHCNLGNALLEMSGRLPDAIAHFQDAISIRPDFVEAHFLLGTALSQVPGRDSDAAAEFQTALRYRPDFEPAQQALQQMAVRK